MVTPDDEVKRNFREGASISVNELQYEYGIPREEITSFRNIIRVYPDPEVIVSEGDREKVLYLLRIGGVDIFKGSGVSRVLIDTIDAVNFFGEMSMINDEPRSATVMSRTKNVVVYRIPNPNIQSILTNPKWAELLVSRLSKNLALNHKHQVMLTDQVNELRGELERIKRDTMGQKIIQARNTRLAMNGILHLQGIIQRAAMVGSKGWGILNALNQVSRKVISHYFPDLDDSDRAVEIDVLKKCLSALPVDEKNKAIEEINRYL